MISHQSVRLNVEVKGKTHADRWKVAYQKESKVVCQNRLSVVRIEGDCLEYV